VGGICENFFLGEGDAVVLVMQWCSGAGASVQ
jgi:hypothetical protein